MEHKKKEQFKNLQMVEIDHNQFAIELVNGNVRVNLTQMAKYFGLNKRPDRWLRSDDARSYIRALRDVQKCTSTDLLIVKKGGTNQGTWCTDYRIAMRFAQWLNPMFAIKVDELLVNLLTGKQAIVNVKQKNNSLPVRAAFSKIGISFSAQRLAAMRGNHPTEFTWQNGVWYTNPEYATYIQERLHVEQTRRTLYVKKLNLLSETTKRQKQLW